MVPKYNIYHSSANAVFRQTISVYSKLFIQNCYVKTVEGYLSL